MFGFDPILIRSLKMQQLQNQQNLAQQAQDYRNSTLLLVFIAIALPELASQKLENIAPHNSSKESDKDIHFIHHPNYIAHVNNAHCISQAINHILPALFYVSDTSSNSSNQNSLTFDIIDRIKIGF